MSQVEQGSLDRAVAPRPILFGESNDQIAERDLDPGSSHAFTTRASKANHNETNRIHGAEYVHLAEYFHHTPTPYGILRYYTARLRENRSRGVLNNAGLKGSRVAERTASVRLETVLGRARAPPT